MTTYEKVIDLCKKRGVKQTALEYELGFGRGSIGKLRRYEMSPSRLQKIADYFGVTVDYLLPDSEEERVDPHRVIEIERINDSDDERRKMEYKKRLENYYYSDQTAELAQELFDNYDYHILMDAARGLEPEKLHALATMAIMLRGTNKDG